MIDFILELLKLTLPSAAVVLAVYLMLKMYFNNEQQARIHKLSLERSGTTLPVQLQAYERLSLFLDRIRIPNLVLRLQSKDSPLSQQLPILMIGVQQEYEHNVVQQIYVSEQLWQIIQLAKNELIHELDELSQNSITSDTEFKSVLFGESTQRSNHYIDIAINAIKTEVQQYLKNS